jgi:hypothetical protein
MACTTSIAVGSYRTSGARSAGGAWAGCWAEPVAARQPAATVAQKSARCAAADSRLLHAIGPGGNKPLEKTGAREKQTAARGFPLNVSLSAFICAGFPGGTRNA